MIVVDVTLELTGETAREWRESEDASRLTEHDYGLSLYTTLIAEGERLVEFFPWHRVIRVRRHRHDVRAEAV